MNSPITQSQPVCRICYHPIEDRQAWLTCPDCGSASHQECWDEIGGCATYGCPRMVETRKSKEEINFWGATEKKCPMCAESISIEALQCPHCHTRFDDFRPLTREDLVRPRDDEARAIRRKAGRLVFFSAIGVTSPISLAVGLMWYVRKKDEIARGGPAAGALVLVSLFISLIYLIVLPLGWLAFRLNGGD